MMKKQFITGFLAGALTFGAIGALATGLMANPNPFPVQLNGKDVSIEGYNIEGSTYFKLRDVADAVGGFDVDFKDNTIVLTTEGAASAPSATGNTYSRTNPAPLNTVQTYTKTSDWYEKYNYSVTIRVMETVRGDKAYAALKERSVTYPKPDEGYEYLNAKIAFSVVSTKADISITPSQGQFTAFTSNNEECPANYYASVEPVLEGSLYTGGNTEGWITVMVKKDDAAPKLAYGLEYDGTSGVWFALQ